MQGFFSSMAFKQGLVIILIAFVSHFVFVFDLSHWAISNTYYLSAVTAYHVSIGVALLLFPVFGLIADVYLTRYRMIQLSLLMLVLVQLVVLIYGMAAILFFGSLPSNSSLSLSTVLLLIIGTITSVGVFEANSNMIAWLIRAYSLKFFLLFNIFQIKC